MPGETGLQTGVGLEKIRDLLRIAGRDHDEFSGVVLHPLQQRVDGLLAETVGVARLQCVRFIDEEDSAHRLVAGLLDQRAGLALELRHQLGAVDFDHVAARQHSESGKYLPEAAGDGGLAGAGIAGDGEVISETPLGAQAPLRQAARMRDVLVELANLLLDPRHADEAVQLGEDLFDRFVLFDRTLDVLRQQPVIGRRALVVLARHGLGLADREVPVENVDGRVAFAGLAIQPAKTPLELRVRLRRQDEALADQRVGGDLHQLVRRVVGDPEDILETAAQVVVLALPEELAQPERQAGQDHHRIERGALDQLDQAVEQRQRIAIGGHQLVNIVHEQHPALGQLESALQILGRQCVGSERVERHRLGFLDDSQLVQHGGDDRADQGFGGAGVAEDQGVEGDPRLLFVAQHAFDGGAQILQDAAHFRQSDQLAQQLIGGGGVQHDAAALAVLGDVAVVATAFGTLQHGRHRTQAMIHWPPSCGAEHSFGSPCTTQ